LEILKCLLKFAFLKGCLPQHIEGLRIGGIVQEHFLGKRNSISVPFLFKVDHREAKLKGRMVRLLIKGLFELLLRLPVSPFFLSSFARSNLMRDS
jgi:hypothetical protein